MPKLLFVLVLLVVGLHAATDAAHATTAPSAIAKLKRMLYRGQLPNQLPSLRDGNHDFKVRLYSKDGALVHEEIVNAAVQNGNYDIVLGSASPLYTDVKDLAISISVNGSDEVRCESLANASELNELSIDGSQIQEAVGAITPDEVNARAVERYAIANGFLSSDPIAALPTLINRTINPMTGLKMEMAFAMPSDEKVNGYYQAGKYGRVNVEYNNMLHIDGNSFGLVGQAMHVAHHMLFYSGGITTDVNGDGMFMFTVGAAHYRVGNRRFEPFVDAPFMRVKFHSSPSDVFIYSEVETTMHLRAMLTSTIGLGFRISPMVKIIGGVHHTEFWMPTEHQNRIVRGLHGIFSYGI